MSQYCAIEVAISRAFTISCQPIISFPWAWTICCARSTNLAYRWDPATLLAGVGDGQVLGVEAPLWGETIHGMRDVEFLAFPRLPGAAETGWSPAASRRWDDYRRRLAAQEPRWTAMGVSYYRSPQVG